MSDSKICFRDTRNSAYMAGFMDALTWCMGNPDDVVRLFEKNGIEAASDVQLLVGEAGMLFERSSKSFPRAWAKRPNAPYDVLQIKIPQSSEMM